MSKRPASSISESGLASQDETDVTQSPGPPHNSMEEAAMPEKAAVRAHLELQEEFGKQPGQSDNAVDEEEKVEAFKSTLVEKLSEVEAKIQESKATKENENPHGGEGQGGEQVEPGEKKKRSGRAQEDTGVEGLSGLQ